MNYYLRRDGRLISNATSVCVALMPSGNLRALFDRLPVILPLVKTTDCTFWTIADE